MTDTTENESDLVAPGEVNGYDEDDLTIEIQNNLKRARGHFSIWRQQAKEDFDFFAGVQWTEEDAAKLEKEGRPPVVFNRIVRTINAVAGVEVQNRQEVKYYPRNIDPNQEDPNKPNDSGFAETLNHAASWVRDQTDAEDEESEAFQDTLICGMGFTETRMDYDEDPQGIVRKDRLDPLMVLVDPDCTKRNFDDAKWIAHIKEFTLKEAREMFPNITDFQTGTFWGDEDMLVHDQTDEWKYVNDYSEQMTKVNKVTIVNYQYWRKENVHIILTPDGNVITLNAERYRKAKRFIDQSALKIVKIQKKVFKRCFFVGSRVTDKMDLGCDHFTIRSMTGLRDRNRNYWFGLVSIMKDPQRWANKWLSQIQHILNSNSKGGVMIEEGAVKNRRDFEDDWADPAGIIDLNPGGLAKIQQKESAPYPDGIDRLLNYAINAINDIPGVNLELIGMAARDQAIGLEMTRKDAGITVLANFFDALRRYRKMDGRILAYFIREYIADGRLIRIVGESGVKYIPLLKSQVAFEYDIIVDDAPTSPNTKEKTFAMLTTVLPMAIQAGIAVPKEILDYAPLPQDLIQKWKQAIAEQEQASQPSPEDQAMQEKLKAIGLLMQQIAAAQAQADVVKTQSETMKNYATAEKDKSVGQEQSALAAQKFGLAQGVNNMKSNAIEQDQNRKDLEMILNQHRKMLEVELDNVLQHKKIDRQPIKSLPQIQ